ncbi:MAG: type VI secretion system protein [Magnetospirillum sp.]|nr:type VI secretion system protein [Magnetospirillum sp.]
MNGLAILLSQPPPWFPWALLVVAVLLVVVVAVTLWWLIRRRDDDETEAAETAPPPEGESEERWFVARMRGQLRRTLGALADMTGGMGTPYGVPWVVVAGVEGAEAWSLIEGVDAASERTGQIPRAGTVRFCQRGALFHAGDDLLAHPGGLRRWRRLLRLLRLCRIHRPVDGLVVAVPAAMLDGPEALPFDRLADKGGQLYELVAATQRHTGLRVPVTVVVTRCDGLRGFGSLVTALPVPLRGEALGWAVPYSVDTAFQPGWADEAVDSISIGLANVGLQVLMAPERPDDADGLMALPSRVRALAPRLKVLLAGMFQPSAYQEAFLFRGLYLAGAAPGTAGGMAFAPGLFNDKVFPEHRLVRPVGGVLNVRTRHLRLAQGGLAVLLAVSAAGLIGLHFQAPQTAGGMTPLLTTIDADLRQMARGGDAAGPAFVQGASVRLLQEMVRMNVTSLTTPLAPTSYVRDPDEVIEHAIAVGYDALIMREMRRRLEARLPAILAEEAQNLRGDGDVAQQLVRATGRVAEFDGAYHTYLDLPKSHRAEAVATLVRYTLDVELPSGFRENARLYQKALGFSSVRPIETVGTQAEKGLRNLFAAAYRARFDERGLRRRLERIAQAQPRRR